MEEPPKSRWLVFVVRPLLAALTLTIAIGIGALAIEMARLPAQWQDQAHGSSFSIIRDATPTLQRWANGLAYLGLFSLLAASVAATYATFRKTRQQRNRTLLVSLGCVLLFVASVIGNNALSRMSQAEFANGEPLRLQPFDRDD